MISSFVVALTVATFRENHVQRLRSSDIMAPIGSNPKDEIQHLGETVRFADIEVSRLFEVFIEAITTIRDYRDYSIT